MPSSWRKRLVRRQALSSHCLICRAKPGERCTLTTGQPRREPQRPVVPASQRHSAQGGPKRKGRSSPSPAGEDARCPKRPSLRFEPRKKHDGQGGESSKGARKETPKPSPA